jgi:hypothetical protein
MMSDLLKESLGLGLGELAVVIISAITLTVTGLIVLIGFRISSDFTSYRERLNRLEADVQDRDNKLQSIRATAAIVAHLHGDSYALHEITRRVVLNLLNHVPDRKGIFKRTREAYEIVSEKNLGELARTALYIKLMDPGLEDSVKPVLDELISKFPDQDTIYFLASIWPLMSDADSHLVRGAAESLSRHTYGLNLSRMIFDQGLR